MRRAPSALAVAAVGPLAGFVAFSLARGDRRVGAYVLVWSILAALVALTHARWPLRRATLWALVAAGWVHLCGGLLPSPERGAPILYETWIVHGVLKFDQLAHASICAVVTVAVFEVLERVVDPAQAGPTARAVLAAVVCWGFGAANELFEFLSALRFRDAYVGGLDNTGWDLAFNTLGSLTAAVVLATLAAAPRSALGFGGERGHGAVPLPERA
jgi:uncharacterized membrane protein YjdF